ncbi:Translocating chain-associated membrane protein 1-like 1 [Nymphon striatum]|nr:Translocating chain-associated membrane protein 1-like 1 [Nymphon striatum]KAG1670075.1 Translocating chain-associated membrane protein 1-like 1 [Nymphon striatum]
MPLKRRSTTKNPPIFSHEFIIQNHADIVSCVAMVFVVGLMFQVTAPIASMFVAMHHNVTFKDYEAIEPVTEVTYTYGLKDLCVSFFYLLICIVMHAIIQEYILDKLNRKLHLSKVKHSKFNESGQLLIFYVISVLWGGDIIFKENYLMDISQLWEGYPHVEMTFMFKFFYIVQLAYWLHCLPELYFQKIKKEEMGPRILYAVLYFVFLSLAYILNFTRVALCLTVLHCIVESIFHVSRLLHFADKTHAVKMSFMVWNVLFVLIRLCSITLTVLTFWYGLALSETGSYNFAEGNFNTQFIRLNCLVAVCALQAWMMWNFINFHMHRRRDQATLLATNKKKSSAKRIRAKKDDGEFKKSADEDVSELPEVDQNAKKELRSRTVKTAKK